jgi:hypothetical protein
MKRLWQLCALALAFVWSFGCTSTEFTSTWKDPSAQVTELRGKRVAAFVVTKDEARRRAAEDALAVELAKRGVQAIPGYKMVPSAQVADKEAVRAKLTEQNVAGAVVMRVVDRRQEVNYVPSYAPGGPGYGSFYGYWDYGWSSAGYVDTSTILSVETLVYSVPDEKLLWGGVSETFDPSRLDKTIKEIVDQAAKEMKKAGLIGP